MHQLPIEQQILLIGQMVVLVSLCAKLFWDRLHKIYTYFLGYLLVELAQTLIPILVPFDSRMYRNWYVLSQALVLFFSTLVVLELYSTILRGWKGIQRLSRHYIRVVLGVSIAISLLPLYVEKTPTLLTDYLFILQRPIVSSLLLFILSLSIFLVYYPIPLGRNGLVYLSGFAVFFVTSTTTIFIRNLGHYWTRLTSDIQMGVYLLCLLYWLFAIRRDGEAKRVVVGHRWNRDDQRRLLAQLEGINDSLLHLGGKPIGNSSADRGEYTADQ